MPIRWKITLSVLLAMSLGLAVAGWLALRSIERVELARLQEALEAGTRLAALSLQPILQRALLADPGQPVHLQQYAKELGLQARARVTVISPTGVVLADSETPDEAVAGLENHKSRPEVAQALSRGWGTDIRQSQTTGKRMYYFAVPIRSAESGTIILGIARLALPLTTLEARIAALQHALGVAFGVAFLVSLILSVLLARGLTRPLSDIATVARRLAGGTLGERIMAISRDEVGILGETLNQMADRLEAMIREVSEDRAQLLAVLSSMVEGVMVLDCKGKVLQVNPALERMFMVRASEVAGRFYREVIRQQELHTLAERVLETQQHYSGEMMMSPSGRTFKVEASFAGYQRENEPCAVLVFHDVTALRRLEKVRKDFVANVSHELRTPLTSIKGYVEALLDGAKDDPETSTRFLRIVLGQADRLNLILEDLLQLSQIESGQVSFKREPVRVNAVVDRTLALIKPLADKKGHRVTVDLPEELPPALGDEERLVQVLTNLLDNAVKYTPEQGEITVAARRRDLRTILQPAREVIEISVSDTGIGIPEADRPRVFERFYRVDKARSRELGGTGLGLAIVKHIVEAHEGQIWVEPNEPHGSRFIFQLPAATDGPLPGASPQL